MPTFETPAPVTATLELEVGSLRVAASSRTDTVVEVLPSNGAEDADVRAAQRTTVTCADGALLVKVPRKTSLFGRTGSVDITVELPTGSEIRAVNSVGDVLCTGSFGDCRIKTSVGGIRLDEAGAAELNTQAGTVRLGRAERAEIGAAGRIDVGTVTGPAVVKNSNGETDIEEVTGELRVKASNGRVSVGAAHAGVLIKSANGAIRVGEVTRGRVTLGTAVGDIEVGIRAASAAWLDMDTRVGSVRNSLGPAEGPEEGEATVEVHARTGIGDIVIGRS